MINIGRYNTQKLVIFQHSLYDVVKQVEKPKLLTPFFDIILHQSQTTEDMILIFTQVKVYGSLMSINTDKLL